VVLVYHTAMDERFERFFRDILRHEGGYVNHPNDPGGETNYGISKRQYPHLDIKNLTREQAKVIYYYDYWVKYRCDKLAKISFQVATKYCDFLINAGERNAKAVLLRALEDLGYRVADTRDMNEDILLAVKDAVDRGRKDELINAFIRHQEGYYRGLAERNSRNLVFLRGWLNRARYRGVEEYG